MVGTKAILVFVLLGSGELGDRHDWNVMGS